MSEFSLPPSLAARLAAFAPCFPARSLLTFQWLVLGWVQSTGHRTVTAVALASGAVGRRHVSVFHRFFRRAPWCLDALGQVLFTLALAWVPPDQRLIVLGDDTLARKQGKSIALASMRHDPLLSRARKPFCSFGPVWVVLAVWVPLPFGSGRGCALPVLFRLYVGAKRGGERHAAGQTQDRVGPRLRAARTAHAAHTPQTKLALLRAEIALVAQWAGERTVYVVVDSAYAGRTLLEERPPERPGAEPSAAGCGAVCRPPAPAPGPEGAAPSPRTPAAAFEGAGGRPPPLGRAAAAAVGPRGATAGLPAHGPLVWGGARAAGAHRGGARPQGPPP